MSLESRVFELMEELGCSYELAREFAEDEREAEFITYEELCQEQIRVYWPPAVEGIAV